MKNLTQEAWDNLFTESAKLREAATEIGDHLVVLLQDNNYEYRSFISWSTQNGGNMVYDKRSPKEFYKSKSVINGWTYYGVVFL